MQALSRLAREPVVLLDRMGSNPIPGATNKEHGFPKMFSLSHPFSTSANCLEQLSQKRHDIEEFNN